jgi:ADP-ribose pyrophosphatase YjhB (NUDIX family)
MNCIEAPFPNERRGGTFMADPTAIKRATHTIDSLIDDPRRGLPEDLFLFASRITPMVNVDLLIKNERGQTLLTWRDDGYWKPGWHIPGGIIRYQESIAARIRAVARTELGAEVSFQPTPLAIKEIMNPNRRVRGHFISFLYLCSLTNAPDNGLQYQSGQPLPDQWMWHGTCPKNIIPVHEIYREYIECSDMRGRQALLAAEAPALDWAEVGGLQKPLRTGSCS